MRILVSGAGVAGLCAGIDLTQLGHDVTIIERAHHLRTNGSPIDVRGEAMDVAASMGVLDAIRDRRIDMSERVQFVDRDGRAIAEIPPDEVNDSADDVEIPREDLTTILHEALPAETELIFEESIDHLDGDDAGVDVLLHSGVRRRYDMVVGADGLHSATRRLAFGPETDFVHHVGIYTALADLPAAEVGHTRINPMYNYAGHLAGIASYRDKALAILIFRSPWIDYDYRDLDAQKAILTEAFAGHDEWRIPELLAAARADPELYFDAIATVEMPCWHADRVVLVGDAAHCASPLSGRGTSLAFTGTWLLAQALREHPDDVQTAFAQYESRQRPHVAHAQGTVDRGGHLIVPATDDAIDARNRRLTGSPTH